MPRHIVLQRFKPEASAEERAALRAAIEKLRAEVPEIRAMVCGDNVGKGPNHYDFALVADFDDMAAFRRYIDSAAHRALVAGPAKVVEKLAAIQHEW